MQLLKKYLFFIAFLFMANALFCQQGKDGAKIVNTANSIVNEYTTLSANASAGSTSITVAASGLNVNARFSGTLAPGDLLMIIQMQGTTINGSFVEFPTGSGTFYGLPNDASWGDITNYNNCGNYELVQVNSVPNVTTITIDCSLQYDYTSAGKVQVIRVPRYSSLTITNPGTIIPATWNGSTGGVVAIEVSGNTAINTAGGISASARGFRGGAISPNNPSYGCGQHAMRSSGDGQKGEGIAGYDTDYIPFGGKYSRGAAANGGGGGDCHNAAGGGGSNAGDIGAWNGLGNPDNSGVGWTTAWDLEGGTFSANTSSGGGRGGYSFSATDKNATLIAPEDPLWTGDTRRNNGGLGGRPLDYSTGKLFLGGGGGSGDRDNGSTSVGGAGGGLVYLMNYGTISGTGSISANGGAGGNSGIDGAGGGGGGGTVVLNSVGTISGISVTANGGAGGSQVIVAGGGESEGPGGGGGGGYIAVSNGAIGMTASAGVNGTTNSSALMEFPPNGATSGGTGLTNQPISNFTITATGATICSGKTATITAALAGTVPGGTVINWYANQTGGTLIGTGSSFTTPVLISTTTYYVGTCPGNYRIPVIVTVNSVSPTITGTIMICSGSSTTLTATGGGTYSWNTGAITTSITVTPGSTTSYSVTVTNTGCTGSATTQVTVNSALLPTISGTTTICSGQSTILTATGGGTYSWNTGATTTSITVTPGSTTSYSVTVTSGGCSGSATTQVIVNTSLSATISGTTNICSGQGTTLTATGGGTYSWDTGATTTSITVSPGSTTSYSVTVTNGGCTGSATKQVTVGSLSPTITGTTTICNGVNTILTATGGGTYSWNTGATTTSITVSPGSTTSYSVTVTSGGCSGSATAQVIVNSIPASGISGTMTICNGSSTTLTATGGGTYSWNTGATTTLITVSPGSTTSYTVTVSSAGCSGSATAQVIVNTLPTASVSGTTTICSGQSTLLTASGGGTYSWDTGATTTSITVSPSLPTTYTVTASLAGCTGTATVQVIIGAGLSPAITGTTTICSGQSTLLTASGGGTYSWNTGATTTSITVSPSVTTTYTITANSGGCSGTASLQVIVGTTPTPSISGTIIICNGSSTILSTSGGGTYSWNDGSTTSSITVSPVSTSTYSVTVTNGSCSGTTSQQVTVNSNPVPIISGTIIICNGSSTVLSTSGGGTYSWNNGSSASSITVAPVSTSTYSVTVTNGGCSGTASQQVTVNLNPVPVISGTATICSGGSTTLNSSGVGTYLWSNGATTTSITITPLSTTTYTLTVTNGSCSNTAAQIVTVTSPVVVNITGNNICSGGNAVLTVSGGTSYSWNTGSTTSVITVSPSSTTSYSVTSSVGLCSATASYTVVVDTIPVVTISPNITIIYGNSTALNVTGGGTYNWLPPIGLSCYNCANPIASPAQTTQYCVTVSNSSGCSANACVIVAVDMQCGQVFVPNAFSPNNDNENDLECVFGNCIQTMTFVIFDRWGEKVFETSDPKQCWDGIYKGELMNTAVFVYYFKATLITGEQIEKKGNISLVR